MTDPVRLQKALADAGLGSRREIERWIETGRVQLNGQVATLGQKVGADDNVLVDGRPVRFTRDAAAAIRVLAYNKPEGEICSRRDPEGRPTVFGALPRIREARWVIVGRLDFNTSGLLLVTDSGELAARLMHPGQQIEREYLVRVLGEVDAAMLARLRAGVALDDGMASFDEVREQPGGSGSNRWFSVVLREGRNREVRRLWESQGCKVSRLKRTRFGGVVLGPRERRGTWRELAGEELRLLCASVGLQPAQQPQESSQPGRREQRARRTPAVRAATSRAAAARAEATGRRKR